MVTPLSTPPKTQVVEAPQRRWDVSVNAASQMKKGEH